MFVYLLKYFKKQPKEVVNYEGFKVFNTNSMAVYRFTNLKKIFFLMTILLVIITVIIFDSSAKSHMKKWSEVNRLKPTQSFPNTFLKVFHLDLKGGPPKLRFLISALPIIRDSGANALLIEYEDMFPFSGMLRNISVKNPYSLDELRAFVEFAESLKMEVIPLVQTFGHLEYALKLEEFQQLRELDSFPHEICPSNKEAVAFIKETIKQIMSIHANARFIHIGCDEVRHLGACSRCSRTSSKKLFARHVIKIADYVKNNYPGVTPLIWDDMLRRWKFEDMEKSGLGSAVELVVWVYGNNIFALVPPFVWNIYQRVFPRIWTASAFKGAFGETETLPNLFRHLENHLSWKMILSQKQTEVKFKSGFFSGIFITGWSRYDHFAVLCELLPVGIPSLILSLVSLEPQFQGRRPEDFANWLNILGCPKTFLDLDAVSQNLFQYSLGNCSFPGSNLYAAVSRFEILKSRAKEMIKRVESSGWVSKYNLKKNFSSPWQVTQMFPEEGFGGELLNKEFSRWRASSLPVIREYFDKYTIAEWIEQNVEPLEEKLLEIRTNFLKLISRKTWPRRPLR